MELVNLVHIYIKDNKVAEYFHAKYSHTALWPVSAYRHIQPNTELKLGPR